MNNIQHPRVFRNQAMMILVSPADDACKYRQYEELLSRMNEEYGALIHCDAFFRKCSNLRRTYQEIRLMADAARPVPAHGSHCG